LTFGSGGETITSQLGIPTLSLGYISSDRLKSLAFSAADLFIFPTRADNLPLVLKNFADFVVKYAQLWTYVCYNN
jgi:hypothetical protein